MNKKSISTASLFVFFLCLLLVQLSQVALKASDSYCVHNVDSGLSYTTIQDAINARETVDGDTILVDEGIYYEHVAINKSVMLVGAGWSKTIVDGSKTGDAVVVKTENVTIGELTVRNGGKGVFAEGSHNLMIVKVNASQNADGIHIRYSNNIVLSSNVVGNNSGRGIFVTNSNNLTISKNQVFGSKVYGINVNASTNGVITFNDAYKNSFDGIGIGFNSTNCVVVGNNVHNNVVRGIWIDSNSKDNLIYRNNIFDNPLQAVTFLPNAWDNGVEGNYWSDYSGVDVNQDGIGDSAHIINADNIDNKPLMGMFSSFDPFADYRVNIISNSTVDDFEFLRFSTNTTIKMNLSNKTLTQTSGFCRICIPYALMEGPYNVTIDGATPTYLNYSLWDDGESRWIYFAYNHSTRQVLIESIMPLDTTTPRIIVESPRSRVYPISNVRLVFSVDEPSSWIGYTLDFEANVTASGNLTLTDLSDGSHSVVVYARDMAGNTGKSATVYFSVDASPPNVSIISPQNKTYATDTVFLSFTVDEPTLWIGYKLDANETVVIGGNTTISALSDGVHSLTVYAEDLLGHAGASETVVFSVDTEAEELEAEPFPIWGVAAIIAVIGVFLVVGVYFLKFRKSVSKG